MTAGMLLSKYGANPWQWVDCRTITGDQSVGIAGIASCGTLEKFSLSPFSAASPADRLATKRTARSRSTHPASRRAVRSIENETVAAHVGRRRGK